MPSRASSPNLRWQLSLPIYKGYYVEDLRTLDLGSWDARGCDGAFLQMAVAERFIDQLGEILARRRGESAFSGSLSHKYSEPL